MTGRVVGTRLPPRRLDGDEQATDSVQVAGHADVAPCHAR